MREGLLQLPTDLALMAAPDMAEHVRRYAVGRCRLNL